MNHDRAWVLQHTLAPLAHRADFGHHLCTAQRECRVGAFATNTNMACLSGYRSLFPDFGSEGRGGGGGWASTCADAVTCAGSAHRTGRSDQHVRTLLHAQRHDATLRRTNAAAHCDGSGKRVAQQKVILRYSVLPTRAFLSQFSKRIPVVCGRIRTEKHRDMRRLGPACAAPTQRRVAALTAYARTVRQISSAG